MDSLAFRAAATSDVAAIVALVQSAYRGDESRAGWTTEADILHGQRTDTHHVAAIITDTASQLLLAEQSGAVVACCHLERRIDHAHFGLFAVRPTTQGRGVGGAVLAEAERIARDVWGLPEMHLTVISVRDELIAWYERRGYRRTGTLSPFPYADERVGAPQRDDLEFELFIKRLATD